MRQTTWTPVYFIAQLFYFIALVRMALWICNEKYGGVWTMRAINVSVYRIVWIVSAIVSCPVCLVFYCILCYCVFCLVYVCYMCMAASAK